jgi:hypothetical protein
MSDWIGVPDNIEDYLGFIYVITHVESGAYYIGKKQTTRKLRRKPLKGQKRVRICHVESDWKTYWGSSKTLLEAVEKHGEDAFERRIVRLCKSKFELSYEELKLQMQYNVLDDPLSFNGILNVRLSKPVGNPIEGTDDE